jgi:hypothetical protein
LVQMDKSEQLRLQAGIRLLADRKGVPISAISGLPLAKIEKDIRAERVTTWDIAREVAIARNLQRLYETFSIPQTMLLSEAVEQGILAHKDALSCYSVLPEEIDAIIKEHRWVAA